MVKNAQSKKAPYHPAVILAFCVIFTFLLGGMIAGINWTRLSKPRWKYPTVGLTVLGFIIFVGLFQHFGIFLGRYIVYASYAVFALVGGCIYFIQKPYYDRWKKASL
jgi:4-amino-4-deoxy-L-arabinose transferase-like glycosyltransferase